MKIFWLFCLAGFFCFLQAKHEEPKKQKNTTLETLPLQTTECIVPSTLSSEMKCQFVRQHCSEEDDSGRIHNLELYYCTFGGNLFGIFFLLLELMILFIFLGTASSDYFCPNLSTLSQALSLPQDLAGVTLLALGNSAPDLFSTLIAIHGNDSLEMALGELIGCGLFVGGAVLGCVCLFSKTAPVEVKPTIFMRDLIFIWLSAVFLLILFLTGRLYWWQGLMMILFYVLYVILVFFRGMKERRRHLLLQSQIDQEENESDDTLTQSSFRRGSLLDHSQLKKDLNCLMCGPDKANSYHQRHCSCYKSNKWFHFHHLHFYHICRILLRHLFPIFWKWQDIKWHEGLVGVLNIPAHFFLGLTMPVVSALDKETEEEFTDSSTFNDESGQQTPIEDEHVSLLSRPLIPPLDWYLRWILILQGFLGPIFVCFVLKLLPYQLAQHFYGWQLSLIIGFVLALIIFTLTHPKRFLKSKKAPHHHPFFSLIGFIIGIFWIYLIANEVVAVLKAIGIILKISETILGITLFAFGNSIGDFISNVTMARLGFSQMAISASFAGPLLNILVTLGVSGLLRVGQGATQMPWNRTIVAACVGLVLLLTGILLFLPMLRFRIGKFFGFGLLVSYALILAVSLSFDFIKY